MQKGPDRDDRGPSAAGGRYWDRTSDLFRVREARYRCANRPGGARQGPSEVGTGFEPVYTALQAVASPLGQPTTDAGASMGNGAPDESSSAPLLGADDRIRTGDPHLGKVMLYQLSYVRRTGVRGSCRGRYWDRTSDLFRVKEARYPCANRPEVMSALSIGLVEAYTLSRDARAILGCDLHPGATRRRAPARRAPPTCRRRPGRRPGRHRRPPAHSASRPPPRTGRPSGFPAVTSDTEAGPGLREGSGRA